MAPQTEGHVREWQGTTYYARQRFAEAWDAAPGTAQAAAAAIAALAASLSESFAGWESLSYPDAHVPPTAARALSDLASLADSHRLAAIPRLRPGEDAQDEAIEYLLDSLRESLDLDMINDFAVMVHAAGGGEDAHALLRTVLMVEPASAGALDNLTALTGRRVAP